VDWKTNWKWINTDVFVQLEKATATPKTDRNLQERNSEPRNCYPGLFCIRIRLEANKSTVVYYLFLVFILARCVINSWVYIRLSEFAPVFTNLLENDSTYELTRFQVCGNVKLFDFLRSSLPCSQSYIFLRCFLFFLLFHTQYKHCVGAGVRFLRIFERARSQS